MKKKEIKEKIIQKWFEKKKKEKGDSSYNKKRENKKQSGIELEID